MCALMLTPACVAPAPCRLCLTLVCKVHWAKLWSDTLQTTVRVPATAAALKCIDNKGGLDECVMQRHTPHGTRHTPQNMHVSCVPPSPACRYLLHSSPSQLASVRALELRQAVMFKRQLSEDDKQQAAAHAPEPAAAPVSVLPSLSARARPAARVAAAQAAEAAAQRRAAANGSKQ